MRRKTKNISQTRKTTSLGGSRALAMRSSRTHSGKISHEEMRFKISLVILMALLIIASYLFALVLVWQWSPHNSVVSISQSHNFVPVASAKRMLPANTALNDPSLDYQLIIPSGLNNWFYKTGFVKDAIDDTQSDQYVKIYLPIAAKQNDPNFDNRFEDILTIINFPSATWSKLDKSCQKGNSQSCDQEGTKITETDSNVYAYIKADDCPKELQSSCSQITNIVNSFKLR